MLRLSEMRLLTTALLAVGAATFSLPRSRTAQPHRAARPSMAEFADEAAAKAAWLAKQEQTSWGQPAGASPAYAAPAAPAHQVGNAWLAPGTPVLTLEAADHISNVALNEAVARGFPPVSVCVMDPSGRVLVAKTMVSCATMAPELAQAKATTCVGFHMPTRQFRDRHVNGDGLGPKMPQMLSMSIAAGAVRLPLAAFPGGILCRDAANNVVGAVGVSGASSDEDEHCAILGAHAVGLFTDPPQSALL